MNLEDWCNTNSIQIEYWDDEDNLFLKDNIDDIPISGALKAKFIYADRDAFPELAEDIYQEFLNKGYHINRLWLDSQHSEMYMPEED